MPGFEIICLANSRKLSGRCIAGLRTDGGGWIRPIGENPDGTLFRNHFTLEDGSLARPLDVLRIQLKEQRPEPHQPENWLISSKPWVLVTRPAKAEHLKLIETFIEKGPYLFGNQSDRILYKSLIKTPAKASLALVIPDEISWAINKSIRGKRQTRVSLNFGGGDYDLVVTDPLWEEKLKSFSFGNHSSESFGFRKNEKFLLTISLGEPFEGYCYKLVTYVQPWKDLFNSLSLKKHKVILRKEGRDRCQS